MRKYTVQVELEIADIWIQDGADPTSKAWKEAIAEHLSNLLPYAMEHEFKIAVAKVVEPVYTIGEREELGLPIHSKNSK